MPRSLSSPESQQPQITCAVQANNDAVPRRRTTRIAIEQSNLLRQLFDAWMRWKTDPGNRKYADFFRMSYSNILRKIKLDWVIALPDSCACFSK